MIRVSKLLTRKTKGPVMVSNSLEKLREMTRYLVELEEEKQAALNDLELERLQLRSLFDSIKEPIHVSHPITHKVLYVNKAAQEIYGTDIVGRKCYEVFHDLDEVCPFCPNDHILGVNMGQTYIWEYYNKKYERWYRCTDRAIYWPDGNGGQLVRFQLAVDITEQKQAEAALKQYSEHLEEMVEQRTKELQDIQEKTMHRKKLEVLGQLAGGVSHELRNPLSAIRNATYLLRIAVNNPDPEVKEMLEILEREVEKSERIINSLLDFTRPAAAIRCEVDVNSIVQTALLSITIPENIGITSQLDETIPIVLADPNQLSQVFGNIILNAIQSMPDGGQLIAKSEAEGTRWIAISFTDTGVGIAVENMKRIFDPLFTTKIRGFGLGLAIIKTLVEGHGGTIEVQSKPREGSMFTVRLPNKFK